MTARRTRVVGGGAPAPTEVAALGAALAALLDAERSTAAPAAVPAAHRSGWRRAAVLEAVRPMRPPRADGPGWPA